MASSVQSRPTYYDILGLAPSATQDDISRAFKRLMGLFSSRPTVATAQLSVAFETLRNPAKRRGYDQMLGLAAAPKPVDPAIVGSGRATASLLGSAWTNLAAQVAADSPTPAASEQAQDKPSASPEPRVATFIASSLRVPAGAVDAAPLASFENEPPEPPEPAPTSEATFDRAPSGFQFQPSKSLEDRIDWRRMSLVAGGLLAAAGVVGTAAGLSVRENGQAPSLQASVSAPVPPARPVGSAVNATPKAPALAAAQQAAPAAVERVSAPPVPKMAQRASEPLADAETQPGASTATSGEGSTADAAPTDELAPKPESAVNAATELPLPKSVIARTIGRIGYPCGSVVSTAAVEGAPGVFSVSCSSGQTYRATPVSGRYHFRRSAG
jgi:hypothetical protein